MAPSQALGGPIGQSTAMECFIRRENIKRFRKLLLEATDDAERRRIQQLLIEEEQKRVGGRDGLALDRAAPARCFLPMLARFDGRRL
jgi:hypothetical protein